MRAAPIGALVLAGGLAHADTPLGVTATATATPTAGAAMAMPSDTLRLELRDTVAVNYPGATAVFSIDPLVAEASVNAGRVMVVGRSTGSTTISVVTATGVASFQVTVVAPPPWLAALAQPMSRAWTVWQAGYESSTDRLTNSLEMVDGNDRRTVRGYVVHVLRLDSAGQADSDPRSSLPAIALEWRARHYELVAFDKLIEHSPLTLEGVTVRGGHVRVEGLELHAGVTSPLLYQNVFLSTQREVVLGASYELRAGTSALTSSVYSYPSAPQTGGSSGTMGSLLYRYATRDDRLRVRAELGYGGRFGAAGDLSYRGATQRAWISARHEPQGFAALGIGRPIGSTFDGLWSVDLSPRLAVNAAGSAARYERDDHHQDIATASGEARYRLMPHLAVSGGASVGRFRSDEMDAVRSITVPIGIHLDEPRFGASAIYRYQANTARNGGGHGGRLSMRANQGRVYASGFVDVQQDAATLELILRDQPGLSNLLNELGLTATSPQDLARLLRENAALSQLGIVEGSNLEFNPWRAQAGAELAWLSRDESRQQLRLRALFDRTQAVNGQHDTAMASLSYARRLGRSVDATGAVSWWSHGDVMGTSSNAWSVGVGLRVRIDDVPHLLAWRRGDITGVVVTEGDRAVPAAGVKVRLDGGRAAVSDASGQFAFTDIEDGEHRVEAELPDGMYFTGASRIAVTTGGSVRFGVARSSAYLTGFVRDDQGAGISGVALALRSGALGEYKTTTDSSGRFRFAVGEGDYTIEPVAESILAGYDVSAVRAEAVKLTAGEPAQVELVVPANRSIAGMIQAVRIAPGAAAVILVEFDRSAAIDEDGHYVFRDLKPGSYTIEVTVGEKTMRRVVEIPAGPAAIRDVDFP